MLAGRAFIPALVAGLVLKSSAADASGPYGPEIALRVGYALPFGDVLSTETDTQALDESVRSLVPIGVDLGYRLTGLLGVGVYADYAVANTADLCPPTALECGATRLRAGLQAMLHFNPDHDLDPWVGLGAGYEALTMTTTGATEDSENALTGLEFLSAQAGLDLLRRSLPVSFGPFVGLSAAQFNTQDITVGAVTGSTEIAETRLHYWVEFGLRVGFLVDLRSDAEKKAEQNPPKKAALRKSGAEGDFDQPLGTGSEGAAGLGRSLTTAAEDAVLLGARRDLHYQGDKVESCECLAVAVGHADDERFWWDCGAPVLNESTQLAFALTADGVPCTSAPVGSLGASYAGYTRNGDDVIVEVENIRPGYPIVEGAIIPRPNPGGAIYVRARRGVAYGRPKGTTGNQCRIMTIRGH